MDFYFGSHITSRNLIKAAKVVREAQGNIVQIFLTNPGQKFADERNQKELLEFKNFLKENNMSVVVHSSYIHNLSKDWDPYSWWLKNLEIEIEFASKIDAIGIVLHFGKSMELTVPQSYNNMYTSLVYVHNKTINHKKVKIILETSTGQGTEICYKIEDLAYFYKKFSNNENKELKERIKLCIDTCHIFAAGYDLRTKKAVKLYLETFEELIGLKNVHLIHLNDCKVDLGCQRDRHQNIGKGFIGLEGLQAFFDFFKKLNVPIILETPGSEFKREIPLLLKKVE